MSSLVVSVWRMRLCRHVLWPMLIGWAPVASVAQPATVDPRLKAAFVYNVLKYTSWPAQAPANPVTLCVANVDSQLQAAFNSVNGRYANGRIVTVRLLTTAPDFKPCNVIYLNNGASRTLLGRIVEEGSHVLTISDAQNFTRSGGTVGLLVDDEGRLQFEINLDEVHRATYVMSSQLLKLARNTQ